MDMTYSNALRVHLRRGPSGRGAGRLSDAELLERATERALDPSIFERYKPFFWQGEISSNRWDSYETRMAPSTLRNYADDAETGVAFLRNHNNAEDPLGATLTGYFTGAQGDGVSHVRADFFALTDPETLPYIAKLQAGVVRDLSVGFYGGQWLCSICGRDMLQWFGPDGCMHLLGVAYSPRDDEGKVKKDAPPEIARATIENAHLAEVSGVYDGATPGAMIGKARALAVDGAFSARSRLLVEKRYRIHLPEPERRWAGLELATPRATGATTTATTTATTATTEEALRAVLIQAGRPPQEDLGAGVRALLREHAKLRALADDGRRYRAELIEETLALGQRAYGRAFRQEDYRGLLERSSLDAIKMMRDDWRRAQTALDAPPDSSATSRSSATPSWADPAAPLSPFFYRA